MEREECNRPTIPAPDSGVCTSDSCRVDWDIGCDVGGNKGITRNIDVPIAVVVYCKCAVPVEIAQALDLRVMPAVSGDGEITCPIGGDVKALSDWMIENLLSESVDARSLLVAIKMARIDGGMREVEMSSVFPLMRFEAI